MVPYRGRFGASPAAVATVIVAAAVVAGIAFFSFLAQQPSPNAPVTVTGGTTTATVPDGGVYEAGSSSTTISPSTTTTSTVIETTSTTCANSIETFGNITITRNPCVSFTLYPNSEEATLESPQVQAYIDGAYHYSVAYVTMSQYVPDTAYGILNVTGSRVVTGNWSIGYQVAFVGNELVNVTIRSPESSTAEVVRAFSVELPDRNHTVTFTPDQQMAIRTALANQTAQSLMTGPPYYVDSASLFPTLNQTFGGDYFLQFDQVQGIRAVFALVNKAGTAVVGLYAENLVSVTCDAAGNCYTNPWGVNPDAGGVVGPFLFTVDYPGPWTLKVVGSDNASGISEPLAYNSTFTGTGNVTVTVPWFSDTGGLTIMATAQRSDAGSALLSLTLTADGTQTTRSASPEETSVSVSDSITA